MINQLVSVSGEALCKKLRAQHVQARLICHPTKRASRERASGVTNSKEGAVYIFCRLSGSICKLVTFRRDANDRSPTEFISNRRQQAVRIAGEEGEHCTCHRIRVTSVSPRTSAKRARTRLTSCYIFGHQREGPERLAYGYGCILST